MSSLPVNNLPADYEERVYAGVLGKIIGVYLGRPFEGWLNKKIEEELGEVWYYVHEKLNVPLIVADDDISGTFTFLRALQDHGTGHRLTSEEIGKTWLNYLIEKKTILWWGGMGVSTEHTAYMRLKAGIPAPQSGSIELNGSVVAEQIGAQIFIDGWAMVCPGDPERAVALAGKAARVSHDGEAVYGAQVVASIEAQAFVESEIETLITTASTFVPRSSVIYALIQDMLAWKQEHPTDWRATLRKIEIKYGYDKYGGGCHMVPNHAVILLGLLYSDDDFQRALMVTNTAGWDTDCNSGNVGCIMGIKNGLAAINECVDFRGPVADRLYLPSADGGRCVTDAVRETYEIVNTARAMQGMRPVQPNQGMRYHFNLPGCVQGFVPEDSIESRGTVTVSNVTAGSVEIEGPADEQMLALRYNGIGHGRVARVATATFLPEQALKSQGYGLVACPTLYSGQVVRARLIADDKNPSPALVRLYIRVYGRNDKLVHIHGDPIHLYAGDRNHCAWTIPDTGGCPIAEIGIEVSGDSGRGAIYMDWMGWSGAPNTVLTRPKDCSYWKRSWVVAADELKEWGTARTFSVVQNEGMGLVYTGKRIWCDYTMQVEAHAHLADAWGIVTCVRGLRRYVALSLDQQGKNGRVRLLERYDDQGTVLAEAAMPWEWYQSVTFSLNTGRDGSVSALITTPDATTTLEGVIAEDHARGGAGMFVRAGHCHFDDIHIIPKG